MPLYKLLVIFELKTKEGDVTKKTFEEVHNLRSLEVAEKVLESQMSDMISEFSKDALTWTILEKCVILEKEEEESDL